MSLSFSLANKVAIVAGAGKGTGKAIAVGLAEAGADVVVVARTVVDVESTAAEIRNLGRRALAVPADVQLSRQVAGIVVTTLQEFNRIDILVNNVGGGFVMPTLELSSRQFDRLVRMNLKTCFLCSKAVAKPMIEQRSGSIINIASAEGLRAASNNPAYGACKAAIINMTMSLAVEWAPYHIRVNAVAPGWIETPRLPQVLERYPALRDLFARVPLGRAAKPEDIAAAVAYLASDASDYVTGITITVDGGLTSLLG